MIDLPEDLAPDLIPLAWLLGTWQGWGISEAAAQRMTKEIASDPVEPLLIWQETSFKPDGTRLLQKTMIYLAKAKGEAPEMMDDAPTGLAKLERGPLLWREDQIWQVQVWSPAQGEEPAQARLLASGQGGPYQQQVTWEGQSLGPRLMAQTPPVSKPESFIRPVAAQTGDTTNPEEMEAALAEQEQNETQLLLPVRTERMHGLVQGELFWSQDTELASGQRVVDFSGRMLRR